MTKPSLDPSASSSSKHRPSKRKDPRESDTYALLWVANVVLDFLGPLLVLFALLFVVDLFW